MVNEFPGVSIVTVCRNAENNIDATIKSVLSQTYKNIEYIIIDGVSTDSTLEIINKYKDRISKIISEPDKGVYDAMNKGIKNATGKYIYFLNAGDLFRNCNALKLFNKKSTHKSEVYYSDIILIQNSNKTIKVHYFCDDFLLVNSVCQQAIIYKRSVFDKVGLFNDKLKIVGDWEWEIRACKKKVTIEKLNYIFSKFYYGGISNSSKYVNRHTLERYANIIKYYGIIGMLRLLAFNFNKRVKKSPPFLVFISFLIKKHNHLYLKNSDKR